jgi:hypothetical protein
MALAIGIPCRLPGQNRWSNDGLTGINEKSAVQQEGVSASGALIDMVTVM